MPPQQPPREPSMEEILASIRRIIADDGPNPEIARGGEQQVRGRSGTEAVPAEVLDLTEIVEESDTIEPLDLIEIEPAKPSPSPAPVAALAPMPAPQPMPAPKPVEPPIATPDVVRRAAPPVPVTPPPAPTPMPKAPQTAPAGGPPLAAAAVVASPTSPSVPAPQPTPVPPAAPPRQSGSVPSGSGPELVSPRAQEQSAGVLNDLVRTVRQEKPKGQPPARNPLEQLVLEALRPSLKAWLEQNLAPLVERVVREEVRRLTRRVEEQ